ncbi:LysR family transcriptional regulator [Bengtsoniella intestinalis]|uniref:LysR family transcriptional regulator n=1 Tax=Bengtsoniella intestinalis TaxID=3073143 RepID=UPI00391F2DCD
MNFSEIEAFLEVVHNQSISKAAKVLFVTQSAISHRIKSLEEKVGCPLIERQKGVKTIRLTQKGERFLPLAEQWIALLEETEQILHHDTSVPISIGCVDSLHPFLEPFYKNLAVQQPRFDLWIQTHPSSSVFDEVENRQLDVGLVTIPFYGDNILCHPVFQEKMQLVCYRDSYPDGLIDPKELHWSNEVYMNWGSDLQAWRTAQWGPAATPSIRVDSIGLIRTLVDRPLRWSICPASVANHLRERGNLDIHDLTQPPPSRISYYVRHVYPLSNRTDGIARFNSLFATFLQDLPPYIQRLEWSDNLI